MNYVRRKMSAVASKVENTAKSAARTVKRKVGSAEESKDPDTRKIIQHSKQAKKILREILTAAEGLQSKAVEYQDAQSLLIDKIKLFEQDDDPALDKGALAAFIKLQTCLVDMNKDLHRRMHELLINNIQASLNADAKQVKTCEQQYEALHTEVDVLTAKVEKAPEKQADLAAAKDRFEEAKVNVRQECETFRWKKLQFVAHLTALRESEVRMHSEQTLQNVFPIIEPVVVPVPPPYVPVSDVQYDPAPRSRAHSELGGERGGNATPPLPAAAAAANNNNSTYGAPPAFQAVAPLAKPVQRSASVRGEKKVIAIYDYEAQSEDELALKVGDVVLVLAMDGDLPDADDGWWKGRIVEGSNVGRVGLFPENHTKHA